MLLGMRQPANPALLVRFGIATEPEEPEPGAVASRQDDGQHQLRLPRLLAQVFVADVRGEHALDDLPRQDADEQALG